MRFKSSPLEPRPPRSPPALRPPFSASPSRTRRRSTQLRDRQLSAGPLLCGLHPWVQTRRRVVLGGLVRLVAACARNLMATPWPTTPTPRTQMTKRPCNERLMRHPLQLPPLAVGAEVEVVEAGVDVVVIGAAAVAEEAQAAADVSLVAPEVALSEPSAAARGPRLI